MKLTDARVFSDPPLREFVRRVDDDILLTRDGRGNASCSLPQTLVVHSPTGFEWGYGGSGPADLALNVLARFVNPSEAWRLHQDFKSDVIARIPREGVHTIKAQNVIDWIERKWTVDALVGTDTVRVS